MRQRIRNDYRLAIITLLGLSGATALCGFVVYRIVQRSWTEAVFDVLVVIGLVALVRLAWRPGRLSLAGSLMCAFNSVFCAAGCWVIGPDANGWVYLALMSNFYLARPRVAAITGGGLIVVAASSMVLRGLDLHAGSTLVTWLLVYAFSFTFADHMQTHSGRLERLASLDALTQIPNRRAMEAALQQAMVPGRRGRVGLLILDIDKFKAVNDTWGHPAGDAVLSNLAALLSADLRHDDAVFRFGGEEFVMLLATPSRQALEVTAERIRNAVEAGVASPGGAITVSIGGALLDDEMEWQDWFAQADEGLFRAKRSGGNQSQVGF